jgi:hypothetical protein
MKTAFLIVSGVAAAGDWTWVDIKGSMCMDGNQTGVWVRKDSSTNLGVYMYGGGACFNAVTCATATSSSKPNNPGSNGIFDVRSDNPLVGYNWMAVPYCTGDVHAGDATKNFEKETRHFNGVNNLKLMMAYATKTFPSVETLFITGESAGGFGSIASYATIRDFYPKARGVHMDDSGPVIDDGDLAVCLQEKMRNTWNINKNLPADCPCNSDEGNLAGAWKYMQARYPTDSFSLISSQSDTVISTFFAYGNYDCQTVLPIGYGKLQAGLDYLAPILPVYQIPGSKHCHTSDDEFYSRVVNNQALYQWIGQLIDPSKSDPASVSPTEEDIWREMYPNSTALPEVSMIV